MKLSGKGLKEHGEGRRHITKRGRVEGKEGELSDSERKRIPHLATENSLS